MSFHFRAFELKDWLVYGESQRIDCPEFQQGKNLIAIHGKNGFGKTSLLKALQFVFHGEYGREELLEAWYDGAKKNGEGSLEIALEFTHKGQLYKIIRMAEFKPWHNSSTAVSSSVQLWVDGKLDDGGQVEDKIQQLIPKGSQQFVFFDGAEITRYAHKQHEEGVKEAIEQVLGIPAVRNLRDDLEKLIGDLEREQAEAVGSEEKNQELLFDIENLENDEQSYLSRLVQLKDKQVSIKRSLEELRQESAQMQVIEVEQLALAEKKKRLADLDERLTEKDKAIENMLEWAPLHMLTGTLIGIVQDYEVKQGGSNDPETLQQARRILESLLKDIQRHCANTPNDCVTNNIKKKLKGVTYTLAQITKKENSILSRSNYNSLSALLKQIRASPTNGHDLLDQKAMIDDQITEIKTDIKRLEDKLKGHDVIQVRENFQQQENLDQQRDSISGDIRVLEDNLQKLQGEIGEKRREVDQLATDSERGRGITATLKIARKTYKAVAELVNELVRQRREEIEKLATKIFISITNKSVEYAGVHVRPDYTLEVYRKDASIVENTQLSAGEKEVLAYSFITALNLSSPDPAPFVMDTPFGHLDSIHRDRLLKSLPQLDVQVFLLATDRDLPPEERSKFQYAIAEEYIIERDQQRAMSFIEVLK